MRLIGSLHGALHNLVGLCFVRHLDLFPRWNKFGWCYMAL